MRPVSSKLLTWAFCAAGISVDASFDKAIYKPGEEATVKYGVVDAAEWLVSNMYAKAGKVSTWGGSYGGYMSVACLVEDQNRVDAGKRKERIFGAGVDIVGIVNVKTFLEKTSGYRRKLREVHGGN